MCGWVKLHRSLLDWEWYDDIVVCRLFVHMLLKANHQGKKWKGVQIDPGSFVTGRHSLSEETGLTEQQIRTALKKLKSTSEITSKTTNKYTVISITCWGQYQQDNQQPNQQTTNNQPTNNHKQECKNDKNEKTNPKPRKRGGVRDDIPYDEIIKSYNELLTELPFVEHLTEQRIRSINGRWDWVNKNAKKKQGMEFFSSYFDYAKGSDFLMGRKSDFKANFDWLMKAQNFIKVIEGNYHSD